MTLGRCNYIMRVQRLFHLTFSSEENVDHLGSQRKIRQDVDETLMLLRVHYNYYHYQDLLNKISLSMGPDSDRKILFWWL